MIRRGGAIGSRRRFLSAAAAAAAAPATLRAAAPSRTQPEIGVLLWSAHSIIDATNRGNRVDRDLIAGWISHLAEHGVKSIFWRGMYVGKATYHSRIMPLMTRAERIVFAGSKYPGTHGAETLKEFNQLAAAVEPFDDLKAAREAATRCKLACYADISPFDKYFPGLEETFYEAQPDLWHWSRDQKQRLRGIPCYAEPAARQRLLAEVTELLNRGVDGISINLLSHAGAFKETQPFGFNPVVAKMYRDRWSGDIINGEFSAERLSLLHGQIFTDVLRDIRRVIGTRRLSVSIPQTAAGIDYVVYGGTCKIHLDWRSWLGKSLVDDISVLSQSDDPALPFVTRNVKAAAPAGRVLLMRKVRDPRMVPAVAQELAGARAGALDGLLITEGRIFEPAHTKWCQIFEKA